MYETYKYIHSPDYPHNHAEVLDRVYPTAESLGRKFVARSDCYHVYTDLDTAHEQISALPEERRLYHEVIFDQPQKLKFDIDAAAVDVANIQDEAAVCTDLPEDLVELLNDIVLENPNTDDKYARVLDAVIIAIGDAFFTTYKRDLSRDDLIICESLRLTGESKYSNHIIIRGYAVTDSSQAAEFTRRVVSYLPERYHRFLDLGVNKRVQNFRMIGCHKGDGRVKRVISGHNPRECYITDCDGAVMLPSIITTAPKPRLELSPADHDAVLAVCARAGLLEDHSFKFSRGGMYIFSRVRSSHCTLCLRAHDNDNTLMVLAAHKNGVVSVFQQCRKYNQENTESRSIFLENFTSSTAPASADRDAAPMVKWADTAIAKHIREIPATPPRTLFDTISKNVYNEPTLRPFEIADTLVVHAMMKMGKTKALREYLSEYSDLCAPVVRFISFRQTFSSNIKENFPDFTLYSDVKGPLDQRKLIVQVESLHRLCLREGDEPPDLLILDECESIFEQFDSGLLRSFTECFSVFQYLLKYSKRVICMDAYISNRTFRILQRMRPGFIERALYHCNTYKNACEDKYWVTPDRARWLHMLYSCIESGEHIAVPSNSLTEAKTIVSEIQKKYPKVRVRLYSSETQPSERREHFGNVNKYWADCDILVYTPTVSAGVSFELKYYNKIFGYFTDQSCPAETCVQMIGRIRDVSDHQFYLCVQATGNNLPATIESIRANVYKTRENLVTGFDHTGLQVEYGPRCELRYHESDYFYLWLENTCVRNMSKNMFIARLFSAISVTGAEIQHLDDTVFEQLAGVHPDCAEVALLLREHKATRGEIRGDECEAIARVPDIDDETADNTRLRMRAQEDIPVETRHAYEKYKLRSHYKYHGDIDATFVAKYRNPRIMRVYKNLVRLYSEPDITLLQMQSNESRDHLVTMELGDEHRDINRRYVYDQHRYALGLLRLCGWTSLDDHTQLHIVTLQHNITQGLNLYRDNIARACAEFGERAPSKSQLAAAQVSDLLKPVNKILSVMYGAQIINRKSDPDIYLLSKSSLFTRDPGIAAARGMPLVPG